MRSSLYMICPTDHLEPVIHERFEGQKYFYTSLGNNLQMDKDTLGQIISMIKKHNITDISFVLSEDNTILLDALTRQNFAEIRGLKQAYSDVREHKKAIRKTWNTHDQHVMMLSYYLNQQIEEFHHKIRDRLTTLPQIKGKLFSRAYDAFREIYSPLLCINTTMSN